MGKESSQKQKKEISIIGTGRAGTSIAYSLKRSGWKTLYLYDKSEPSAFESKEILGEGEICNLKEILNRGDFFIISVPDGELKKIAKEIAQIRKNLKGKTFIHISGSISYRILIPLKRKGASIGSLHPVFPFPTKKSAIPEGTYFGWEGEEEALKRSAQLVRDLKGKLIKIKKKKTLYHLACSIASNLTSILFLLASEKALGSGIEERTAKELLFQLSVNSLVSAKEKGWEGVTGPSIRGDKETIKKHLKNLSSREKKIYKEILIYFIEKGIVKVPEKILKILENS